MNAPWERRWHPLREEWIIVAAHRQARPWVGDTVDRCPREVPAFDPTCPLCPGNERVNGDRNPDYSSTFVFDNDHPCVAVEAPTKLETPPGFYRNGTANGVARVICYSPRHDMSLAEMEVDEVVALLCLWQEQFAVLSERSDVESVLVFENKGTVVGVSNPHPHCQIYAANFVFTTIERELSVSEKYRVETGRLLFDDIVETEICDGRRILCDEGTALAFVPYFARYAYEVFVAPKERHGDIAALSAREIGDLARALKTVLVKYDNLWQMSFPYVLVLHQAPPGVPGADDFHFHIEIYPPLRQPNLLKYLAGPEIGAGNFLADTSPEEKAADLRSQPTAHYKQEG